MDYQEASTEVDRLLSAELGSLVHGEGASVRPPVVLGSWRLSPGDKEFLSVHGLPALPSMDTLLRVGALFQSSSEPEYAGQGWNGYVVAQCGDVQIVVSETSGSVFAVPDVRDMAPALAHVHPDRIQDELINSRLAVFVDFCWRWYWLAPLLVDQRDRADRAEMAAWEASRKSGSKAADVDFHAPYRELCSRVRANFHGKDRLSVEKPQSMWSVMIDGFE
ncbi:SUKH-4 family immunity protein [Streptomyces sp. LUP30]|uniref:SUKH-4 family immunity protein n=1 Tax=Streptomyces sp. LUP30 TaxID=1890285 RepID=UPI00159F291F|nr:SUKH-4 family immunity protein [Streptomyces sp. LUP30]